MCEREDRLRMRSVSIMLRHHCLAERTWVEELLGRANAIPDRFIAELYARHCVLSNSYMPQKRYQRVQCGVRRSVVL